MKHHENGPSSLYRRWRCPGSMHAERGLKEISNKDAKEGTELHEAVWRTKEQNAVLSMEQQSVLHFAKKDLDALAGKYHVAEWVVEKRVSVYDKDWNEITFGTPDAYGIGEITKNGVEKTVIVLVDFKFGRNPVDQASSNLQLAAYALALHQMLGIGEVVAMIIQPRVVEKHKPYTFTQFNEIRDLIAGIIRRASHPTAKRCAGTQCTYCKTFGKCKKADKVRDELMMSQSVEITKSNAEEMYEKAMMVEKVVKKIKAQCKQLTDQAGGSIGRLEIQERKGARQCQDLQKAYEAIQEHVTVKEFLSFCTLRIADFEGFAARRFIALEKVETVRSGVEMFRELVPTTRKKASKSITLKGKK